MSLHSRNPKGHKNFIRPDHIDQATAENTITANSEIETSKLEIVQELLDQAQQHTLLLHTRIARRLLFKANNLSESIESGFNPLHSEVCLALANNLMHDGYISRTAKLLEISRMIQNEDTESDPSLNLRIECATRRLADYDTIRRSSVYSNPSFRTKEINFVIENFEQLLELVNDEGLNEYSRIETLQSLARLTGCYELVGDFSANISFAYLFADLATKIFGDSKAVSANLAHRLSSVCITSSYTNFIDGISAAKRCQSALSENDQKNSSLYWNSLRVESDLLLRQNRDEEALMTLDFARFISNNIIDSPEISEIEPNEYISFLDECGRIAYDHGKFDVAEEIWDDLHNFKKPRVIDWVMRDASYEEQRAATKNALGKNEEALEILNQTQNLLAKNGLAYSNDRLNLIMGVYSIAKSSFNLNAMELAAQTLVEVGDKIYPHPDNFNRGYTRLRLIEAHVANGSFIEAINTGIVASPILATSLYTYISPLEYSYFASMIGHSLLHLGDRELASEWLLQAIQQLQESSLLNDYLFEGLSEEEISQSPAYAKMLEANTIYNTCCVGLASISARAGNRSRFNYYRDSFIESHSKMSADVRNNKADNKCLSILLAEECRLLVNEGDLDKAKINFKSALEYTSLLTDPHDNIFKHRILSIIPTTAIGFHTQEERIKILEEALDAYEENEVFANQMVSILRELSELYEDMEILERSYHAAEQADTIEAHLTNIFKPDCPILPEPPEEEQTDQYED